MFDYDGTLTPIVSHPDLANLPPATRNTLAQLAALDRVCVGVISGRGLGNLRGRVDLPGVWYGGSGGMHLDLGGEEIIDGGLAAFDRVADSVVSALAGPVGRHPGAWVEQKPGCLAVHFRALTPLDSAVLLEDLRDTFSPPRTAYAPLRVRAVSKSIEIALTAAWTKEDAVAWMHAGCGRDSFVVYAGDAANDEEAVDCVNALQGVTIGIGPDAPWASQIRLPTTAKPAEHLSQLETSLSGTCCVPHIL